MDRIALITKMRKVLALANQGIGGEKHNAERQLEAMCKRYGINREELEGETKRMLWLSYSDKDERKLAHQVIVWATESYDTPVWKRGKRREVGADLTEAQRVQVLVAYGVYCREYAKIKANMFTAFISRNELYAPQNENAKPMDPEREAAVMKLMWGIDKTTIHKQVTHETH
jgi:hypothetical protein